MLSMACRHVPAERHRHVPPVLHIFVQPGRQTHILMGLCLCAGSCGVFLSAIICSAVACMGQPSAAHQHDACLSLQGDGRQVCSTVAQMSERFVALTKYINSSSWNRTFSADVLAPTYFCNAPTASKILPGCRPANLLLSAAYDCSLPLVLGCSTAAAMLCWCELQNRQNRQNRQTVCKDVFGC